MICIGTLLANRLIESVIISTNITRYTIELTVKKFRPSRGCANRIAVSIPIAATISVW